MPVTSIILSPQPNAAVDADETTTVRGLAWSGGGRGIVRVDVSGDNGATWHTATLAEGSEQPMDRAWAWTFWEAELPPPAPPQPPPPPAYPSGAAPPTARAEAAPPPPPPPVLICKAVDAAHNTQPEHAASVWNLRGLANNCWHRVPVTVAAAE